MKVASVGGRSGGETRMSGRLGHGLAKHGEAGGAIGGGL